MDIGMGWVAFWGFLGKLVIAAAAVWIAVEVLDLLRAIYMPKGS